MFAESEYDSPKNRSFIWDSVLVDFTVADLLALLEKYGMSPIDVKVGYLGCGSHRVEVTWNG
jgi:phage gp29-like protein